ncbi:MAG: hypothetical protein ABIQ01_05780 [Pseudolysinimonas sp.]
MTTFTIHIAGEVRDLLQRCSRCGAILMDRRSVSYHPGVPGEPLEPKFWELGQGVMVGHTPGGPSMLTGMLGMNPDRDTSDEVDCEPRVSVLMSEGDLFAVGDDMVWLEQAQVVAAQMESTLEDGPESRHMVLVEAAGIETGSHGPRQLSMGMTPDAAVALADSLIIAARAALEAGEAGA